VHTYSDSGNLFVAEQISPDATRILDIGCGSGDTARLIKARMPGISIQGITHNGIEASAAERVLDRVHVFDIEADAPLTLPEDFDCLLFSHVLEHMRNPAGVLKRFASHLVQGGSIVIAVPNVLEWRTRMRFLRGDWSYAEHGILDRTHLKFFTYQSAERELLGDINGNLILERKLGDGAVPFGPLRRIGRAAGLARIADQLGVRLYPNLFAQQIILVYRKQLW
jgi:SAM-dependent methyltransferase